MRPITGSGNMAPRPPFALTHFIHTGQSKAIGQVGGVFNTTQPYRNKKLSGVEAAYPNPLAGGLSLAPLIAPQRPNEGLFPFLYPDNMLQGGESAEIVMANEVTRFALNAGYLDYPIVASCVGATGVNLASIQKGSSSGNAYAAGLFEAMALASGSGNGGLAAAAGFPTVGAGCLVDTHGESDSLALMTAGLFASGTFNLRAYNEADMQAIFKTTRSVPLVYSQVTSAPFSFYGECTSSFAQFNLFALDPKLFILCCPQYQWPYETQFHAHFLDYRPLGGKYAQGYFANELRRRGRGPGWSPLYVTSSTRSGQTVTCNFNIPVGDFTRTGILAPYASLGPIVFDTAAQVPHGPGTLWSMWGPGKGFEVYDCARTATAASGTPIVVTLNAPLPAAFVSGMSYAWTGCQGNTNMNGVWPVDVIDPTHMSLRGSTSNAAYINSGSRGFAPIGITSATINGSQVVLTIARAFFEAGFRAYALHGDQPWNNSLQSGGFPDGRCGLLHDSDPYVVAGVPNPNWCLLDEQPLV